jgi:hypothetical protein
MMGKGDYAKVTRWCVTDWLGWWAVLQERCKHVLVDFELNVITGVVCDDYQVVHDRLAGVQSCMP